MEKIEAIEYLKTIIESDTRHKDYVRVTELADLYRTLYTGEGIEAIIKSMYDVDVPAKQITSIIPPILKSTQYPFNKVFRAKPVEKLIDFDSDGVDDKVIELKKYVAEYWGGQSLEDYMQYTLIEYGYIDPNAWIVTEFKPFDPNIEKAKPYPFLVLSHEAIDYEIDDGELKYLVVLQSKNNMDRFTMYLKNDTIVMQQVERKSGDTIEVKGKYFVYSEFEPKGKQVPAVRVGYIPDLKTRGRTYVSMFDKIVSYLLKIIKVDYESDMSQGDLAFPKRYEYIEKCNDPNCTTGRQPDGSICQTCRGTGQIGIHKTATDIRTFTMPRDKDEFFDLRQMTFTDFPPVEGLRFQQELMDKRKGQAMSLMFNADIFDKTQISATATEHNLMRDNLNDAVYPLALNYQRKWTNLVRLIATFTDNDDKLIASLQLPKDFKFKTVAELMADLFAARNAKASVASVSAIEDDINEMLYADRPDELNKIRIKNALNPFFGYSEEMVRVLVAQKETTKFNSVLYANLESIMSELETDNQSPWLYDLAMTKIRDLVSVKVEEYILKINEEKPDVISLPNPFNPDIDEASED